MPKKRKLSLPEVTERDIQWLSSMIATLLEHGMDEDQAVRNFLSETISWFYAGMVHVEGSTWPTSRKWLAEIGQKNLPEALETMLQSGRESRRLMAEDDKEGKP